MLRFLRKLRHIAMSWKNGIRVCRFRFFMTMTVRAIPKPAALSASRIRILHYIMATIIPSRDWTLESRSIINSNGAMHPHLFYPTRI